MNRVSNSPLNEANFEDYLVDAFRAEKTIKALAARINSMLEEAGRPLAIMEVCGGHTHNIVRYNLPGLLHDNLRFIHGPGCPVCIMPRGRVDHAIALAKQPDVILVTLGDMLRVPGSSSSLQQERAAGADIRFVYSPLEVLTIAKDHPGKKVIFFAIGFETTTPMTAALLQRVIETGSKNVWFHMNHVLVCPAVHAVLSDDTNQVDALIAPSHVSVITGAEIYRFIVDEYKKPVVVGGFEPVDILESTMMLVEQLLQGDVDLRVQYTRNADFKGNLEAQQLISKYFRIAESFQWRGLGEIPASSLQLRSEFAEFDAELHFAGILPSVSTPDHKLCLCPSILKGKANPVDCRLFGRACTPASPLGACMVSSEGACASYYKYGAPR